MTKAAYSFGLAAGLALILAMGAAQLSSARNRTEMESGTITITLRVYDYVKVNRPVLLAAEAEATAILKLAGVDARWVACATSQVELANYPDCQSEWGAGDFVLRVLPKTMVDPKAKGQDSLGIAYESDGLSAYVANIFYDHVLSFCLSRGESTALPILLGRAVAHEIGHLLLGTHAHCNIGIMRPFWSSQELRMDARLYMLFTPEQSRHMKTRLAAREESWQAEHKVAKLGRR